MARNLKLSPCFLNFLGLQMFFVAGRDLSELPKGSSFKVNKVVFCLHGPFNWERSKTEWENMDVLVFYAWRFVREVYVFFILRDYHKGCCRSTDYCCLTFLSSERQPVELHSCYENRIRRTYEEDAFLELTLLCFTISSKQLLNVRDSRIVCTGSVLRCVM